MKLNAVQCGTCNDIIYSRANHDFHRCGCKSIAVDAGPGCGRIVGSGWKTQPIEVDATKKELYDDWNSTKNKYGVIRNAAK